MRVVGYVRVSTERQDLSPEAQRGRLAAEADRRGWELVAVVEDRCSGSVPVADREAGAYALALVRRGEADAIAAAKTDRLCRSVLDGAGLIQRAQGEGWGLVLLDLDLDTTTPVGRAVAHVMLAFAELERARIAERTREGLAVSGSEGARRVPPAVAARIRREHGGGKSLGAIARDLTADGVPTARGGARWYPSTVRGVLARYPAAA